MGNFTILMNNATKALTITNKIKLHQYETLVDKLYFIVDYMYTDEIDLRDFNVCFQWTDPSRVAHVDVLEKEIDIYKEKYQRYSMPVTSPINKFSGEIEGKLVFTKTDYETEKRYKLESDTVIITIDTIADYYKVKPDESFDYINDMIDTLSAKVDELSATAQIYESTKADDHIITEDGELYLTSNGQKIGTGLNVATVEKPDEQDDIIDGIIDISGKYPEILL